MLCNGPVASMSRSLVQQVTLAIGAFAKENDAIPVSLASSIASFFKSKEEKPFHFLLEFWGQSGRIKLVAQIIFACVVARRKMCYFCGRRRVNEAMKNCGAKPAVMWAARPTVMPCLHGDSGILSHNLTRGTFHFQLANRAEVQIVCENNLRRAQWTVNSPPRALPELIATPIRNVWPTCGLNFDVDIWCKTVCHSAAIPNTFSKPW